MHALPAKWHAKSNNRRLETATADWLSKEENNKSRTSCAARMHAQTRGAQTVAQAVTPNEAHNSAAADSGHNPTPSRWPESQTPRAV
jgi:hypothetical protein